MVDLSQSIKKLVYPDLFSGKKLINHIYLVSGAQVDNEDITKIITFMFNLFTTTLTHTLTYITENLSCLSYGIEVFIYKYLINFACYDLLVDISESFGVWTVLFVLLTSSLLVSVLAHQYNNTCKNTLNTSTNAAKPNTYKSFLKFSTLTKTKF